MNETIINEIRDMQEELDRRTAIENQAIELMKQGRYKEAKELLDQI